MATVVSPRAQRYVDELDRLWTERPGVLGWLTTTDHKRIGIMYFFTALAFFGAGGVEALLIRTQLIAPHGRLLTPQAYDEVFTMHGITMIFLFVIPMTTGAFGNYLHPLDDRGARHGVPAPQRALVLDLPGLRTVHVRGAGAGARAQRRLV